MITDVWAVWKGPRAKYYVQFRVALSPFLTVGSGTSHHSFLFAVPGAERNSHVHRVLCALPLRGCAGRSRRGPLVGSCT